MRCDFEARVRKKCGLFFDRCVRETTFFRDDALMSAAAAAVLTSALLQRDAHFIFFAFLIPL